MGGRTTEENRLIVENYQKFTRLEKYPHYYINSLSGKIKYRRDINGKTLNIYTGIVGKLNPKTGTVDGIAKAREIVEQKLEEIRTGKSETQVKRERQGVVNPSVESIWTHEFLIVKLEGKTIGTTKNYIKEWKNGISGFWGTKTCRDVTTENISKYKAWYLKENPERLFDKTFDFIKMFFRFLRQRGFIEALPDWTELNDLDLVIKKNKKYKKAGRVYTPEERVAMLAAWQRFLGGKLGGTTTHHKKFLAARARLSVRLGLFGGLRAMEALTLKYEHVDEKKMVLNVWSLKNHKWREVPLVPEVLDAIKYQQEANRFLKSDWIFPMPSDPDKHLSDQLLGKTWYRVRMYAGVIPKHKYDARFHDLRKTFATQTAELGWPVKVACEILDMSMSVYEKVYASHVSTESKTALMTKHFGGAR